MASNDIRMRVLLNVDGKQTVAEVTSSVRELQSSLAAAKEKSEKFKLSLGSLSNISMLANNAMIAFQSLGAAMQPFIDKSNNAAIAQEKLRTVMSQRMQATPSDVAGINNLVSAQSKLGVIGGTVQRSGLQQVATFASQASTLQTLLPAMNNLIAQQKGLNATSEDAVTIANMMGKALMGNAGAMTRVGITLTDAQKKIIQTGDEGQRAAAIAQAINENVGQMNRNLAKTDAGKVKQLSNEFGGLQAKVGKFFSDYQNVIAGIGQVGMAVSGIAALSAAVKGLWTALGLATVATKLFSMVQVSFQGMSTLVTAAITGQTLSVTALRTAIKGTILSLGLIGVAYMGLSAIIESVASSTGLLGDKMQSGAQATERMTYAQRSQATESELLRKSSSLTAQKVGEVTGKFTMLQSEWKKLRGTGEQTAWIKKNQGAFSALGLSIGDVTAAQRIFVSNAPKVINALKSIAEADAYKEEYGKSMVARAKWESQHRYVKSAAPHIGDTVSAEEGRAAGIRATTATASGGGQGWQSVSYQEYRIRSKSDLERVRAYRQQRAQQAHDEESGLMRQQSDYWGKLMGDAMDRAREGTSLLEKLGSPYAGSTGRVSRSGGRVGATASSGTKDAVEKELDSNRAKIEQLSHESLSASGERKQAIAGEIAQLQLRNKEIEDGIALAKGEKPEKGSKADLEAQLSELQRLQDSTVQGSEKWKFYGAEIDRVKSKLDSLESPVMVRGSSGLNSRTIDLWREGKQEDLSRLDMGTSEGQSAAVKIMADMSSMDALKQSVENALTAGITLPSEAVENLYDSIFNSEDIPTDQLQGWVDAVNEQLEKAGLGKLTVKVDPKGNKQLVDGGKEAKSSWKDAAKAVESVGSAMASIEDPTTKIAATIAQAVAEIALGFANALSKEGKAGVWGWIAAAAAGTATMIATIASVKSATRHAGGGIVGGNTPSGDLQPVLLNSGELVLNKAQQGALASQLQDSRVVTASGTPYVTGEEIYLGLSNYLRRRGYGEIVTTRG